MEEGGPRLIPIYASGYFRVDYIDGLTSVIEYVYHDVDCYYYGIISNPEAMEREREILVGNFQTFLDEEDVYVNGHKVRGKCVHVEVTAPSCSPAFVYFYNRIGGKIKKGLNVYKNYYRGEESSYPYHFLWWFPEGTVIKRADFCGSNVAVENNLIIGRVKPGERLCGKEVIEFLIK